MFSMFFKKVVQGDRGQKRDRETGIFTIKRNLAHFMD
jgi:hypothetical protein